MAKAAFSYRLPYTVGTPKPYATDTGCDIEMPVGSPVIAIDDGPLLYSEGWGGKGKVHTRWVKTKEHPNDTPGSILQLLDHPITWQGRIYTMAWYSHLSNGALLIRDGIDAARQVYRGQMIGRSGTGRSSPHLHFGLIDRRDQSPGHFLHPFEVQTWLATCVRR